MKRSMLLLTLLAILLAGCTSPVAEPTPQLTAVPTTVTGPLTGGIEGDVLLGPTCPVIKEGDDCTEPYAATLSIQTLDGSEVTRATSDENGYFKVDVAPGTYTIHPLTPEGMLFPVAADIQVVVEDNHYTKVRIEYDSGIR